MTVGGIPQETDEFDSPRERLEAHPTILSYWRSRTDDQIVAILCGGVDQRNVFGTYPGTRGDHMRAMLQAVREPDRAKVLLWQEAWRTGRNEPLVAAHEATQDG